MIVRDCRSASKNALAESKWPRFTRVSRCSEGVTGRRHPFSPSRLGLLLSHPACLPCKSSAGVDKQLDRTLLLICYIKSGLSSSLNICTIGGKAWRKNNKQKYVGRRITSFVTEKKTQTARGQACFTFVKH